MPKVPIAAFIAILCSGFVLVPILVFARMWILRDAPKTSWNEFAFLAFTLYGFMVTIDGVLIFKQTMDELRLVKIFPEKKDEWKVIQGMSTPFANMVCLLFFLPSFSFVVCFFIFGRLMFFIIEQLLHEHHVLV
jgi:hypothetical protein